ncbi:MAG TPA: hypothetical protein VFE23_17085 [Usitatibacter sp.]|jgi:hypothetical protein|nr:hypothetical protein [Usitatibacter sp.]
MATINIRVIRDVDFVRATPDGALDSRTSIATLREVAAATSGLSKFSILLDLRRVQSTMNEIDLWHLAAEIQSFDQGVSRACLRRCRVGDRLAAR